MSDWHTRSGEFFRTLQDTICAALAELDGHDFQEDAWEYATGGGGRSRVLVDGKVFEKAGVNFSDVRGEFSEEFAAQIPGEGRAFRATGISLVLHPRNPHVPTVHANFRHIEKGSHGWFGGGADLTPYYLYPEDCRHFHQVWKAACDRHAAVADFPKLKKWCDDYFHLKHRGEARGIGGIFFDYFDKDPETTFAFVQDAGKQFLEAYLPIARRRHTHEATDAQRQFQLYRRGRYVEFNLIYDRGTIFGLKTGGRTESILMSLPPLVRFDYNWSPQPGSREADLYAVLREPRDWLAD